MVTVRRGDTLIGLGQTWLANPGAWPALQTFNRIADPLRLQPGSVVKIPESLLKAEPAQAVVESVTGEVSSSRGPIAVGSRLSARDVIATAAGSYAAVRLPNGSSFVVQPLSRLRIEQLQRLRGSDVQQSRLGLPQGRIDNQVVPQRGPRARYEIRTPTAVIGVRGTAFRTAHDPQEQRSRVEVTTGVVASGAGTQVVAGKGAVLDVRSTRVAALLPAPDTRAIPRLFERALVRIPLPETAGAAAHRVIVADARGFSQPLFEGVSNGPEMRVPDLPDGDYVVRLRAIGADGLEGFDADQAVRLKARPEPPFPRTPAPGGKQSGAVATFEWAEQPQAAHYRIQVADQSGFDNPVIDADAVDGTRFSTRLSPDQYQWRLASVRGDGDRGPWSDPLRFTLKAEQGVPEPPTVGPNSVSFAWPGEAGQRFTFQLAQDGQFTRVLEQRETADSSLSLPTPTAGEYFVRVQATDPDGYVGPWSQAQRLEVPYSKAWWLLLLIPLAATL